MNKLKWQIHGETSITQIMLWIIIILLTDSKLLFCVAMTFIIGNIYTMLSSVSKLAKLDSRYFKE